MNKDKIKIFLRRSVITSGILLIIYLAVAIGYFFLPWSIRKPIYKNAPSIDRTLRKHGFHLVQAWDDIAFWGHDAAALLGQSKREDHVYAGRPIYKTEQLKILENIGYTVGYSENSKNPLWVAYRLFNISDLTSGPRKTYFSIDHRTEAKVKHDDYTNSRYDRGHMAPNYGIATRYGAKAQKETFLMSNIILQKPRVNQTIWKDIEIKVAKRYGRYFNEVWVITGPVFTEPINSLSSGIAIPSHYYKIIADEHNNKLRVLAFLVDKHCPSYTRIKTLLVSVDEIEELTGIDFFTKLPTDTQATIESEPASRLWPYLMPAIKYHLKEIVQ